MTGGRGRTGSSAQVAQASWPCRERKRRSRVCGQEVGLSRQEEAGLPGPALAPAPRHVSHEQRVPESPSPRRSFLDTIAAFPGFFGGAK